MSSKQIGTVFSVQSSDLCRGPQTIIVLHDVADVDPLAAFGEVITMVARARLVERVTAGDRVIAELGDGRAFELWPCGETLYVSGWGCDGPVELRRFRGDFEDNAAEAVAALIEECER